MKRKSSLIIVVIVVLVVIAGTIASLAFSRKSIVWKDGSPQIAGIEHFNQRIDEKIDSLKLDVHSSEISFKKGATFEVESSLMGRKAEVIVHGRTLEVNAPAVLNVWLSPSFGNSAKEKIVITIPEQQKFTNIEINDKDSAFLMENIDTEKFSLDLTDSDVTLENFTVANLKLTGYDSTLKIKSMTLKEAAQWSLEDSTLIISHSTIPPFSVTGEDSSFTLNQEEKTLPYQNPTAKFDIQLSDSTLNVE